jgi:hypothetical protein
MSVLTTFPFDGIVPKPRWPPSLLSMPEPCRDRPPLPHHLIGRRSSIAVPTPQGLRVFRFYCPASLLEVPVPLVEWAVTFVTQPPTVASFQKALTEIEPIGRRMTEAWKAGRQEEARYWEELREYRLWMLEHWQKRARKAGRRQSIQGMSYAQWYEKMREARESFFIRGETPTEPQLMAALGIAGDDRRVREWLDKLNLSWEEFLDRP